MSITNVPELTGTEVLADPVYPDLPQQIVDPSATLPEATEFSDHVAHWSIPPHAYACTSRYSATPIECRGQVLRVAYKGTDEHWFNAFMGVCQRPEHRRALADTILEDIGFSPISTPYALFSERFPLIHDEAAPTDTEPESVAVELPGHTDLQRRLLAYTIGFDGTVSTRHSAFQYLAENDAFYPGRPDQRVMETLLMLVEENPMGACSDGLVRFRQEFGLSSGRHSFRANLVQAGTNTVLAVVVWVAETDDCGEAEDAFTEQVALGDLDGALRRALYDHDGGDLSIDFSARFDVVLSDIEDLGPVTD